MYPASLTNLEGGHTERSKRTGIHYMYIDMRHNIREERRGEERRGEERRGEERRGEERRGEERRGEERRCEERGGKVP